MIFIGIRMSKWPSSRLSFPSRTESPGWMTGGSCLELSSSIAMVYGGATRLLAMVRTRRSTAVGTAPLGHAKHALPVNGSEKCIFARMLLELAGQGCRTDTLMPPSDEPKIPIPHDEIRYRKRHKIENSFARLKDWRRVATRYDRCPKVFLSACALAAVVMFW